MGKKVIHDAINEINEKRFRSVQFSMKTELTGLQMNPMERLAHRLIFNRLRLRVPTLISTILTESFLSHSQFQVRVDNCLKLRHD